MKKYTTYTILILFCLICNTGKLKSQVVSQYGRTDTENQAILYFDSAKIAMERTDFDQAKRYLEKSLVLDSTFADAYSRLATCLIKTRGDVDEVTTDIIKALMLEQSSESLAQAISVIYQLSPMQTDMLLSKLNVMQREYPNERRWFAFAANAALGQSRFYEAAGYYQQAVNIDANPYYQSFIADLLYNAGNDTLALEAANKIGDDLTYQRSYLKAKILMSMGNYQEALLATDSCINIDANRPSSYFERGMIKDKLADIKGAILDFSTVIDLDTTYSYAYYERGEMYSKVGNMNAAIKDYNKALQLNPTPMKEGNSAPFVYLALGQRDKAIAFTDSILTKYSNSDSYYNAACLYGRLGNKQKSLLYLSKALEKGFRRLKYIQTDPDLTIISNLSAFKVVIKKYKNISDQEYKRYLQIINSKAKD